MSNDWWGLGSRRYGASILDGNSLSQRCPLPWYPLDFTKDQQLGDKCLTQQGPPETLLVSAASRVPSGWWRSCTHLIFLFLKYLFIWLCRVLVGACSIFDLHHSMRTLNCGMWDLVTQPGIEAMPLAVKTWSPNHWTTRECLSCAHFRFLIATYALFCLSWNAEKCKLMATRRQQDALAGMFFTGCCSAQIFGVTSQESLKSQDGVDAQLVCLPMFHCICAGQ